MINSLNGTIYPINGDFMTLEVLNDLLKKLRNEKKWFKIMQSSIEECERKNSSDAERERVIFGKAINKYSVLKKRLLEVIDTCLTDEEKDLMYTFYVHGKSLQYIMLNKYICRSTFFRQLKIAKEKIIANW